MRIPQIVPGSPLLDAGLKLGLLAFGWIKLQSWWKRKRDDAGEKKSDQTVVDNPAVGIAQSLRIAMNPSGARELFDVDGTNATAIMKIASQIKDLKAVVNEYRLRYNASLLHHLEVELGPEKYQQFLALAGAPNTTGQNYNTVKEGVKRGYWVRTLKTSNIRKTPAKTAFYQSSNIMKEVEPGKLLGMTTGKAPYDSENDIIFIEVFSYNAKREKIVFYVAKSQVEIFSPEERKKREAGGEKFNYAILGAIPSIYEARPALVTIAPVTVYDMSGNKTGEAPARTVLGYALAYLNTGKRTLVQFETVEGLRRWTDQAATKIITQSGT